VYHFGEAVEFREVDASLSPIVATSVAPHQNQPDRFDISRGADIVLAATILIFVLPLMIFIALAMKAHDGGPVIFSQTRIGRDGKRFKCLKFRSMELNAEARLAALLERDQDAAAEWARDHKLRNDPRITAFGRFLRSSSLDELPQLLNVLKGEMSLVGPRPIVEAEISRYGRYFRHYCSVRPGITGLWQASGRNDVAYRRRIAMDTLYAQTRNIRLYMQIIILTIPAVLARSGSY
jgi:lipopolysaccharide/colanic/teichoic acid biosynthesis glycosyltransferase